MTLYNLKTKQDLIELTYLYFKFRNLYLSGFQRYIFFRNLISYVTNLNNYYSIRSIFNNLINEGSIEIKKEKKKVYYRFNPNGKKDTISTESTIVLNFD